MTTVAERIAGMTPAEADAAYDAAPSIPISREEVERLVKLATGRKSMRPERTLTIYRDDSTVQVVYDRVKAVFWTADNSVLVVSRYHGEGDEHYYIHWPRERFCWFKDVPTHRSIIGDGKDTSGKPLTGKELLADLEDGVSR